MEIEKTERMDIRKEKPEELKKEPEGDDERGVSTVKQHIGGVSRRKFSPGLKQSRGLDGKVSGGSRSPRGG